MRLILSIPAVIALLILLNIVQVHKQVYFNDTSTRDASSKSLPKNNAKILIYITTHMSNQHKAFFKHCWPLALEHSHLLSSSDVNIFMTPENPSAENMEESMELLHNVFGQQNNLKVNVKTNEGLQQGAINALVQGEENGWFSEYDWVVRLNPDVIIQNDSWMLETMNNDRHASLLYADCYADPRTQSNQLIPDNVTTVHTDFNAFRPAALPPNAFGSTKNATNAEMSLTKTMAPIVARKEHRHIPGAYPQLYTRCRLNGNFDRSPVVHYHMNLGILDYACPATFW